MPKQLSFISYTMPAGGATKTFPVSEKYELYKLVPDGGAITLTAPLNINPLGTAQEGMRYDFEYGGNVTRDGNAVTIFGYSLSDQEALAEYKISCTYIDGSWEVKLELSANNGTNPSIPGTEVQPGTLPSSAMDSTGIERSNMESFSGQGYTYRGGVAGAVEEVDMSTAGAIPIGNGTTFTPQTTSGDVTISTTGVMTIGAGKVKNSMLETPPESYLSANIEILEADVLTLFSAPIEIVPAPGLGLAIDVVSAFGVIKTYAGTPYATNTVIELGLSGASTDQLFDSDLLVSTVARGTKFQLDSPSTTVDTQYIENAGLTVAVRTGNPTNAGTGSSINIYVTYRIVKL